jgi:serine/threonine protein kinase
MKSDDARNAFLKELLADLERGGPQSLEHYQRRFAGHEALVASEYERLVSSTPSIRSAPFDDRGSGEGPSALLGRLAAHTPPAARYEIQGEFARGGMGAILKIHDTDLRRTLAMKVVLGRDEAASTGSTPAVDESVLARFLEEAMVTGQLEHPGVVPVHELGVDASGHAYFTMRLVRGLTLKEVFELVREEREGWTRTRALGVLLRACETMAYAHSKGVVHRDLKPPNVMVGHFGEVYVMDWGLAKVAAQEDLHDLRLKPEPSGRLQTQREGLEVDSPLITLDGTVLGTPCYMSLEQAEGRVEDLGPRSDVYAMGAILYELLAGHAPYTRPGVRVSAYTALAALLRGPPRAVSESHPDSPAELVAICERAMARESDRRYADMSALAADLSAYLEGRVVGAYEVGAWAEVRKWVGRNRSLAAALVAILLTAFAGLGTAGYVQAEGRRVATKERDRAVDAEREVRQRLGESALARALLEDLVAGLWQFSGGLPEGQATLIDEIVAARGLLESGRPDEAERAALSLQTRLTRDLGLDEEDRVLWRLREIVARARWALGQTADARQLALEVYEYYSEDLGDEHPDTRAFARFLDELGVAPDEN